MARVAMTGAGPTDIPKPDGTKPYPGEPGNSVPEHLGGKYMCILCRTHSSRHVTFVGLLKFVNVNRGKKSG